jgi:Tfp pilus assembly protein PilN
VAKKTFRRRQPFFALAAVGLCLIMLCWWVYFHRMRAMLNDRSGKLALRLGIFEEVDADLKVAQSAQEEIQWRHDELVDLVNRRGTWTKWLSAIHESLIEGMWLTSLKPVMLGGKLVGVEITGRGFMDKLRLQASGDVTGVEVFWNRLRAVEFFDKDATEIIHLPPPNVGAYARDFTIRIMATQPDAEDGEPDE